MIEILTNQVLEELYQDGLIGKTNNQYHIIQLDIINQDRLKRKIQLERETPWPRSEKSAEKW
jgi:hypothetical protein